MDIDRITDSVFAGIISGRTECTFNFLALKILLGRLKIDYMHDSSDPAVHKYAEEIRKLLRNNRNINNARNDINIILKQGGQL